MVAEASYEQRQCTTESKRASTHLTSKARTTTTVLPMIVGEHCTGDAIKVRDAGSRTSSNS